MTTTLQSQLRTYFDGTGFDRWAAIYGQGPLSSVRQSIREGHARMLTQAETWLAADGRGQTLLDAGCGTGLFTVAMAKRGYQVTAVDIAPRMIAAARRAAEEAGVAHRIEFLEGDVEQVTATLGRFDVVVSFDVLVHYPREPFRTLCTQLAQCSDGPLLMTYAPYSRLFAMLHKIGGFFPKSQRRTEIQMTPDTIVAGLLAAAGKTAQRTVSISKGFYHVKLLEAK